MRRSHVDNPPKDYYGILGVPKDATQEQIKSAYYELSKIYHPDTGQRHDDPSSRFSEITEAYDVLGNFHLRKKYDSGLLPTATPGERSTYKSIPIDKEEFYRSRLKTSQRMGLDKPPIYDVDKWTKLQISQTIRSQKDERERQARNKEFDERRTTEKDGTLPVVMMVLGGVALLAYFLIASKEDDKGPKK